MTNENEQNYDYELMGVLDILKSFGEATQAEIESYPSSDKERFKELKNRELITQVKDESGKELETYTLTGVALELWNKKKSYGDTLHSLYQLTKNEFKILQALASQGPMTVAELVRSLNIDVLYSAVRLRHIELVVKTSREESNSIFWEISGEQLDELRNSLAARVDDNYYREIAVEVAGLETLKNFRSSFTGDHVELDENENDDKSFISGNPVIVVEVQEGYSGVLTGYLKNLFEEFPKGKVFKELDLNTPVYRVFNKAMFAVTPDVVLDVKIGDSKTIGRLFYQEQKGQIVLDSLLKWIGEYIQSANSGIETPDESVPRIHILSVLESSAIVVDCVTIVNPYPSNIQPARTFHADTTLVDHGFFDLEGDDVLTGPSYIEFGQALYERYIADKK